MLLLSACRRPIRVAASILAPLFALGLLAAAPRPAHVTFRAPAGTRPAGPLGSSQFAAVLPSGQLLEPLGQSVRIAAGVAGFAIAPSGHYAIVAARDGASAPFGGALVVVDTRTMALASRVDAPHPFGGATALRDPLDPRRTLVLASVPAANAVDVFTLDNAGKLAPDTVAASIPIPPPLDAGIANFGWAAPSTIIAGRTGRAYVLDLAGDSVVTLDVSKRAALAAPLDVGYFPAGAALAGGTLVVADQGLAQARALASPAMLPAFAAPAYETDRSSALSFVALDAHGDAATSAALAMDAAPDGVHVVGGAQPAAVAIAPRARYAFVAMAGVDRIATVDLQAQRVIGGTELRLYDRGPYGTQPVALALSRNGTRLYVALAGINAVAVLDARNPRRLHRLGLLPTGWAPVALALSADGRRLFVANAHGTVGAGADAATFERIDLARTELRSATRRTLADQRALGAVSDDAIVPQVVGADPSAAIKHVVLILAGNRTFDSVLGDLGSEPRFATVATPSLARYGATVTPNLHALAATFALAGNMYTTAGAVRNGDALALAGTETALELRAAAAGAAWPGVDGLAPDDYPRMGYLFNSLAARHMAFRDYGVLLDTAGFNRGRYDLDVPALAALAGSVDLRYPGRDPRIPNDVRSAEFVADYGRLDAAANGDAQAGAPSFVSIRLASEFAGHSDAEALAAQDRALGTIVDFVTHRSTWASTAIFVLPEDAGTDPDHVDGHRSYALVISPYAKRGYLGMRHVSTASVLKTEEELLGLPTLALPDTLATDMSDFFSTAFDATPYTAVGAAR
jgi:hypothetical protein